MLEEQIMKTGPFFWFKPIVCFVLYLNFLILLFCSQSLLCIKSVLGIVYVVAIFLFLLLVMI